MRLTPDQVAIIRQAAQEIFGPEARVWLFGSRVGDSKRGGHVDLLVESDRPIDAPAFLDARCRAVPASTPYSPPFTIEDIPVAGVTAH